MALTRSQARKLSQELDLGPCSKTPPAKAAELRDLGCESAAPRTEDSRVGLLEPPVAEAGSAVSVGEETEVAPLGETGTTLSPVAESWCELSKVDRETLIREQREDLSIKALMESVKLAGNRTSLNRLTGRAKSPSSAEMGVLFHNGSEMCAGTVPVGDVAATSEGNEFHMRCSLRTG
ncbi:hypothetical protein MTO96_038415 [Rhipicephalus appendiculatus]